MEELAQAKQRLRSLDQGRKKSDSIQVCKERLLYLDEEYQLPHIASQIDHLQGEDVVSHLFSWFMEHEFQKSIFSCIPLFIGLLKSKS